jgi:hypothetical protein
MTGSTFCGNWQAIHERGCRVRFISNERSVCIERDEPLPSNGLLAPAAQRIMHSPVWACSGYRAGDHQHPVEATYLLSHNWLLEY